MTKTQYEAFGALNPFFEVVMRGLRIRIEGQRAEGLATLLVNVLKVARTILSKEL